MAFGECHRWSILGIIVAFLELFLAYILLCGSSFMFMASEFMRVFGLHFPCPCTGILGYQNRELCLYKPLFQWPMRKIYAIQNLARNSLPVELFWHGNQDRNSDFMLVSDIRTGNGRLKIEDQTFSSTEFDARLGKIGNQKQKGVARRRRKVGIGFGKLHSARSSGSSNLDSVVYQMKSELNSLDRANGVEGNISYGDDATAVGMLEKALAEESSARACLCLELEKERAAAASAADEAMAMILRLQADKALLEMEAKQYGRMMEERFMYDEEEMNVLKEIIVRREKENHFLEKELEAYQQIDILENGSSENDSTGWKTDKKPNPLEEKESVSCGKEPIVYDVHVIEDQTDVQEKDGEAKNEKAIGESPGSDSEIKWLKQRPGIGAEGEKEFHLLRRTQHEDSSTVESYGGDCESA